jgi:hypothetical protein
MDAPMQEGGVPEDVGTAVPLEWDVPDDLVPRYATNFVVQATGHEFVISFFETMPPVILGSPEERLAKAQQLKSVRARCVARIVVSPSRMAELVNMLQDHFNATTLHTDANSSEE